MEVVAVTGRGEERLLRDTDGMDIGVGGGEKKQTGLTIERRQRVCLY